MQGVLHCFRVLGDNGEQDSSGSVWVGSALFPVSHRGWRKTEAGCEFRLTQIESAAYLPDVDFRNANGGNANGNFSALRPLNRFGKTGDDLLSRSLFSLRLVTCNLSFHCTDLLAYSRISSGTNFFSTFLSAVDRSAFSPLV